MRVRCGGEKLADRVENRAAGEHEVGALRADAAIGDTLVEIHAAKALDGARRLVVRHPQPVDAPTIVALEAEMHAGERRHRAGGAEQMEARAAPLLGGSPTRNPSARRARSSVIA